MLFISYLLTGETSKIAMWLLVSAVLAVIINVSSIFDLVTGIKASKRLGNFKTTSFGLRQTISKDRDYMMYYFLMFLIDCCLSFFVDFPVLCTLCAISEIIIEVISIRENMSLFQILGANVISVMKIFMITLKQIQIIKI